MVGRVGACMEVKVLLPLRCLAYGDPPHSCCSTFQVSVAHAREIYNRFLVRVYGLYKLEYLRLPTETTAGDLKAISTLHKAVDGVVVVEDAASFPPGFAVDIRDNTNNIQVGFRNVDDEVAREVVRNIESTALENEVEWQRLQLALTKWRGTFASKVGSSSGIVEV
jgi:hypothetical protein